MGLYYTAEGDLGPKSDKRVIEVFLKEAFSKLHGREFTVRELPDVKEREKKSVDALAASSAGETVAIEHTLIEAFAGDLEDRVPFSKVFVPLRNDPKLRLPNEVVDVVVRMGAVQKGTDWNEVQRRTLIHLQELIPTLPRGGSRTIVPGLSFELAITLHRDEGPFADGRVFVARHLPPSSTIALVTKALAAKLPKLCAYVCDRRVLLFEIDSAAASEGEIANALEQVESAFPELTKVDEVWCVDTAVWEHEGWTLFKPIRPMLDEF
jgi:hypothetical protein